MAMNLQADLEDSFNYHNRNIKVEWFDALSKVDLPDLPWQQVYIIGNLNGLVPVVKYQNDKDNLPGGKVEPNETIEQTLHREIKEELNCSIVAWQPLGYQKNIEPGQNDTYQLRVYAEIQKTGEFTFDPGGSVTGYKLVRLEDLNSHIQYGKVGERMIGLAKVFLTNKYFNA